MQQDLMETIDRYRYRCKVPRWEPAVVASLPTRSFTRTRLSFSDHVCGRTHRACKSVIFRRNSRVLLVPRARLRLGVHLRAVYLRVAYTRRSFIGGGRPRKRGSPHRRSDWQIVGRRSSLLQTSCASAIRLQTALTVNGGKGTVPEGAVAARLRVLPGPLGPIQLENTELSAQNWVTHVEVLTHLSTVESLKL